MSFSSHSYWSFPSHSFVDYREKRMRRFSFLGVLLLPLFAAAIPHPNGRQCKLHLNTFTFAKKFCDIRFSFKVYAYYFYYWIDKCFSFPMICMTLRPGSLWWSTCEILILMINGWKIQMIQKMINFIKLRAYNFFHMHYEKMTKTLWCTYSMLNAQKRLNLKSHIRDK